MDVTAAAELLAPLRDRYAHWLTLDEAGVATDREEAAEDVRALPLVLRVERDRTPSWHAAMTLACRGAARICLDARSAVAGPWHDAVAAYAAGHIRKVTRRARGAHWVAAAELPGVVEEVDGTEVRTLLPGRVAELDPRIARLQVGGTDAPVDDPLPAPGGDHLQLLVPPEPETTLGKAMAQSGHAGMIFAALAADPTTGRPDALARWVADGYPVVVRRVDASRWTACLASLADPQRGWETDAVLAVRDAGFTEVDPGTVTLAAQWVTR